MSCRRRNRCPRPNTSFRVRSAANGRRAPGRRAVPTPWPTAIGCSNRVPSSMSACWKAITATRRARCRGGNLPSLCRWRSPTRRRANRNARRRPKRQPRRRFFRPRSWRRLSPELKKMNGRCRFKTRRPSPKRWRPRSLRHRRGRRYRPRRKTNSSRCWTKLRRRRAPPKARMRRRRRRERWPKSAPISRHDFASPRRTPSRPWRHSLSLRQRRPRTC